MDFTVYLAPKGFVKELVYELGDAIEVADRLVFAPGPPRPAAWAQNIWLNPQRIPIDSIGDAANKLRALQRNWALFSVRHHRRARLIEEKLPAVRPKPVGIGTAPPTAPLGSWTLLDKNVIVASPSCSSPFPHGEVLFVENKQDPPNRAYLKLWELFTLLGQAPSPGSFCLDLGGSPGGWTWVLASLGCRVLSVDKAPLDPRIEMMEGVESRQLSAFALDPREVGVVDWLFCDVVCYPDRLWRLVDRWRTFGRVRNFVCTVKFQGATDHETAAKFAAFPGARLVHLFNNKHELTWALFDQRVEDEGGYELVGPKFSTGPTTPPEADAPGAAGEDSTGAQRAAPAQETAAALETPAVQDDATGTGDEALAAGSPREEAETPTSGAFPLPPDAPTPHAASTGTTGPDAPAAPDQSESPEGAVASALAKGTVSTGETAPAAESLDDAEAAETGAGDDGAAGAVVKKASASSRPAGLTFMPDDEPGSDAEAAAGDGAGKPLERAQSAPVSAQSPEGDQEDGPDVFSAKPGK